MRRIALPAAGVVLALLVASQLLLPSYFEGRFESHLAAHGGHAHASVSAFPALRLLFGDGDSIHVKADGLAIDPAHPPADAFRTLDEFDTVDVRATDTRAGPFTIGQATIHRPRAAAPYSVSVRAGVSPSALATYAGERLAGNLGTFLAGLLTDALPLASQPIPIDLSSVVRSDGGRPVVVAVRGTVAGIPAAPLIEAIAAAVAGHL